MVTYIFGPEWFYGIDTIFDMVSIVVSFMIAYFGYRCYKYSSQKRYLYFSSSFFLVALAFIIKIITTIPVYAREITQRTIGFLTITTTNYVRIVWIHRFGIFLARFLMISSFLMLFLLLMKIRNKKVIVLLFYFALITTLLSQYSYFVFHLTLALFLFYLSLGFRKNYLRTRLKNAGLVMCSFYVLFLSQLVFIFDLINKNCYVVGEVIQLVGYLILLFTLIRLYFKK